MRSNFIPTPAPAHQGGGRKSGNLCKKILGRYLIVSAISEDSPQESQVTTMSIDEVMTSHGFNFSASCGGKGSYTKWIKHQGKRAYIAITDASGESFPTTLDEPVRVAIHDLKSGDEVEAAEDIGSLRSYLESLEE
jgi:hypothetical protein